VINWFAIDLYIDQYGNPMIGQGDRAQRKIDPNNATVSDDSVY
jgi:hypothetical protein